jgi:hypothetical protein
MHEEICDDCGEYMEECDGEWYCVQAQGCKRDIFSLAFSSSVSDSAAGMFP